MARRVPYPFDDCSGELHTTAEVAAGGVVDRIHVDRLPAGLRAQRVDECLANSANARWLAGTPGEHHVHVRARLGDGGRDGRAQQCRHAQDRGTKGACDSATGHDSTPTHNCGVTTAARLIRTPMFVLGKHDPISRVDGQWQLRLIKVKAVAGARFSIAYRTRSTRCATRTTSRYGSTDGITEAIDLYEQALRKPRLYPWWVRSC